MGDFWDSTPKRMTIFFDQYAQTERALDARAGVIAAVIANSNRGKGKRALQPGDFFPALKTTARKRRMSDGELRTAFLAFARPRVKA